MREITLNLDGAKIRFHFDDNHNGYVPTQITISAVEQLSHVPTLNSIKASLSIIDLKSLARYFSSHLDDIEFAKKIFTGYHLLFEVTAYQGEPDKYFDLLFSVNVTENSAKAPRVYYGVRCSVNVDEVKRFISEIENLVKDYDEMAGI